MSEQSRIETAIDATLDNCELFRAQIAEQARVIASLRQHKNEYMDAAEVTRKALLAEIDALKAQSSGVVLPCAPAHSDDHSEDALKMVKVPRELLEDLRDLASDAVEHHRQAFAGHKLERQANMDDTVKQASALLNGGQE